MKQRIRYRGRAKKVDAIYIDNKFAGAIGTGLAKDYKKKKRR